MSIKGRIVESDWRWAFAFPCTAFSMACRMSSTRPLILESRSVELFTSPNRLNNNKSFPYLVTSSKTNDLIWWFIDSISLWVGSRRPLSRCDICLLISPQWWSLQKKNKNNNDNNNKHLKIPPPSGTGIVSETLFDHISVTVALPCLVQHIHGLPNLFTAAF